MNRPLLIIVGADKGGVGKTVVSRALVDLLVDQKKNVALFDTEPDPGVLHRFVPAAEIVDLTKTVGRSRVFDQIAGRAATLIDVRATLLTPTLRAMGYSGMLAPEQDHDTIVLHVLNPEESSLGEAASVGALIGETARHYFVKNRAGEDDFEDWDDTRQQKILGHLDPAGVLELPHLDDAVARQVDARGCSFRGFEQDERNSTWSRGTVRRWLADAHAEMLRAVRELKS